MIGELEIVQNYVIIHCDSQSVIHLTNRQVYHERRKNIDVMLYFIRDVVEFEGVRIVKIASEDNPANMFTKSLPRSKFNLRLD